jgi:P-type Mg2+ transporter
MHPASPRCSSVTCARHAPSSRLAIRAPVLLLTSVIMAAGLYLPFSTLGSAVRLAHVPRAFFGWLALTLLTYGALTQLVKTWYIRRFHAWL